MVTSISSKKMNENTSHSSKNEFIRSFFGRIHGLTICFWNYLTFNRSNQQIKLHLTSWQYPLINYLEDELEDEDSLLRRTEATVLEITAEGTAGPVKVVLDLVVILPLMLSGLLVPSVLEWKKEMVLNLLNLMLEGKLMHN